MSALAITGASLASADTPVQAAASGTYGGGVAGGGQGQDPSRPIHPGQTLLTGTVNHRVTAAAKAKEPGGTVERVETDEGASTT